MTSHARILVVDDEPNIVTPIVFLLEKAGYAVETASDGLAGLEAARLFRPQVVLLDVMMPEMNGFEAARRLRELPGLADVRIVFLTAKGTENDRRTGYSSGAEYYIVKPFDNDTLLQTVAELLAYG
jgi:two-component system alkaline phosphatase synthesis response regulator PhoP